MAAQLDEHKSWQGVDGKPLVDGYLYIGQQGADPVLNPITIYSDRELTTAISNPQRLDAYGKAANKIWIPGRYSYKTTNVDSVQQEQQLDAGEETFSGITKLTNVQGINAITAEAVPAITAYTDREIYLFQAASTNTGAVTLDGGGGAKSVVGPLGTALTGGEIQGDQTLMVVYNESEDEFQTAGPGLVSLGEQSQHIGSSGSAVDWVSGGWEFVGPEFTASSDALVEISHTGIDVGSPVDFVAGYSYMIEGFNFYNSINNERLDFQAYVGSAYVTTSTYFQNFLGASGASPTTAQIGGATSTTGYGFAVSGSTAGNNGSGRLFLYNAAHATLPLFTLSETLGYTNSGYSGFLLGTRFSDVVKRIKLFPSGGSNMTAGTFRLYRRKDT